MKSLRQMFSNRFRLMHLPERWLLPVFQSSEGVSYVLRAAIFFTLSILSADTLVNWSARSSARAQVLAQIVCDGQWITNSAGGQSCLCPDGTLASGIGSGESWVGPCALKYGGAPQGPAAPQPAPAPAPQSVCPYGTQECGNYCCNPGFYCSKYGCVQQGAIDCGGWACPPETSCSRNKFNTCIQSGYTECSSGGSCGPGLRCTANGQSCMPRGNTECGNHSCGPGYYCGSQDSCLAQGATDCGNGRACPNGQKCSRDGSRCLDDRATECGDHACEAGYFCGSQNSCLAQGTTDCGNGKSCPAGKKCSQDGKHCFDTSIVDCGSYFCNAGNKCGSGARCLASGDVDCGGRSCSAGYICRPGGSCASREEIVKEQAIEKQRKRDEAARRTLAAAKMKDHVAQAIRDMNQRDKYIAQQKLIAELTYKAKVVSIIREEIGFAAENTAFLLAPIVGEYTGAVKVGKATTLTYVAGKQAVKTLLENGFEKVLESKGYIPSQENQDVVVRMASPVVGYAAGRFGYPIQLIIKREDLLAKKREGN